MPDEKGSRIPPDSKVEVVCGSIANRGLCKPFFPLHGGFFKGKCALDTLVRLCNLKECSLVTSKLVFAQYWITCSNHFFVKFNGKQDKN